MDRPEFLEMCQKVSILSNGVCNIKQNVPDELLVRYNDIVYYPVAYKLSFEKGELIHTAILHDLKANAIIDADLKRVKKYDDNSKLDKI